VSAGAGAEGSARVPPTTTAQPDPTLARLEERLTWYDRRSAAASRAYKWVKLLELLVAAAVVVLAGTGAAAVVTAATAALVVVLEGVQHLFQWQLAGLTYGAVAQGLRREHYLFQGRAGPYIGADRRRVLAERVEAVLSQEPGTWSVRGGRAEDETELDNLLRDGDTP
jgi:hypothetical protein